MAVENKKAAEVNTFGQRIDLKGQIDMGSRVCGRARSSSVGHADASSWVSGVSVKGKECAGYRGERRFSGSILHPIGPKFPKIGLRAVPWGRAFHVEWLWGPVHPPWHRRGEDNHKRMLNDTGRGGKIDRRGRKVGMLGGISVWIQ